MMPTILFTKEHEYVRVDGEIGAIGITDFAQNHLGDIVFTELPAIGTVLGQSASAAVVESVKAASDIFTPVSGEVVEINSALLETPNLVNEDPLGNGWFFKLKLSNASELDGLMDEAAYQHYVASLG
jgi:glycine cleavage system H protein